MDTLEKDIFGDSNSELSSEDEERKKIPKAKKDFQKHRTPPRPSLSPVHSDFEEPEDDNDNDAYIDDQEQADQPASKLKFTKSATKGGKAGETDTAPKKRKKRIPRPTSPTAGQDDDVNPVQLDPEELRRLNLMNQIESLGKTSKSRPKKRKKGDEDDLDRAADEQIGRLKHAMGVAAAEDQDANMAKQPATAKLKMLPDVMQILQRNQLTQSIMDQNLLEAVRQWLEPLSDKSLPALNIQNAFFEVLPKMDIDTNTLKESGIGRIVMFYTRSNKRVTPTIKRAADALLAQWSRPIIKRSSSYRDRAIATGTIDPSQQRRAAKLNAILAKGREEDAGKVRKNAVRIPERSLGTYTVAPKHAATSASTQRLAEDMEKRKFQNDRVRKVQRKLDQHRQKSSKQ